MTYTFISVASSLTDTQLMARLQTLAGRERESMAELIAHLAVLDTRPSLYAADGYGSLFRYCTDALHLSEDAACTRIDAARTSRRFPMVVDLLASGDLTLSSLRRITPHLTPENHVTVLERARGRSLSAMADLIAEVSPKPDVPASIRRLPKPRPSLLMSSSGRGPLLASAPDPFAPAAAPPNSTDVSGPAPSEAGIAPAPPQAAPAQSQPSSSRSLVEPLSPERYRIQFTMDAQAHATLRRLQDLLRREIPDGDPARIVGQALTLLLETVDRRKVGAVKRPRASTAIRRETDDGSAAARSLAPADSRGVPRSVMRAVWRRDGGQCAFVSAGGRRCSERSYLEFHHIHPFALGGRATVENIALRCRRHNQYEAEHDFGKKREPALRSRQTTTVRRYATRFT